MLILPPKIRWSLIGMALVVMAGSALVSAGLVQKNERIISELQSRSERQNELIRNLWQDTALHENRLHTFVIYSALGKDNAQLERITKHYAKNLNIPQDTDLMALLDKIEAQKVSTLDRIDDLYIEKIAWDKEIASRIQKNTLYMGLAIFMQFFSIAVITIVRDLK